MATRPTVRGSKTNNRKSTPKTQAEINRIKPSGTLTFAALEKESTTITPINIKLGDEVLRFYHVPMTVGDSEEFFTLSSEASRVVALRRLLSQLIVNEDGSPFADEDQYNNISMAILNKLFEAIVSSAKEEPGED